MSQIAGWLTALGITSVAAASFAFWFFRQSAKSWLQSQFDRDLEEFKAAKIRELEKLRVEYQHETEKLKSEISRLLDRATKLHQREYEILPEAWGILNKALVQLDTRFNLYKDIQILIECLKPNWKNF